MGDVGDHTYCVKAHAFFCTAVTYSPEEILLKLNAAHDLLGALQWLCGWCRRCTSEECGAHERSNRT